MSRPSDRSGVAVRPSSTSGPDDGPAAARSSGRRRGGTRRRRRNRSGRRAHCGATGCCSSGSRRTDGRVARARWPADQQVAEVGIAEHRAGRRAGSAAATPRDGRRTAAAAGRIGPVSSSLIGTNCGSRRRRSASCRSRSRRRRGAGHGPGRAARRRAGRGSPAGRHRAAARMGTPRASGVVPPCRSCSSAARSRGRSDSSYGTNSPSSQ